MAKKKTTQKSKSATPEPRAGKKKVGGKATSTNKSAASTSSKKRSTSARASTKKSATGKSVKKKTSARKKTTPKAPLKKAKTSKTSKVTQASKKKSSSKAGSKKSSATKSSPRKPASTSSKRAAAASNDAVISRHGSPHPNPHAHTNGDAVHLSDDQLRKVKSGLTKKHLAKFRDLLRERRHEIVGDMGTMQNTRGGSGELSHMPLHMADVGSDNYEQEFTLGLMESERRIVVEIDNALQRIHDGTYGVCLESGQPIPKARLEVQPWAKYCIEVMRDHERRGLA